MLKNKYGMTSKKPFWLGYFLVIASFVVGLVGFGTGYWYVSGDSANLFKSIGLWQACFDGYEHTSDLIGKAYYGCWWLFYKEYYYIKDWLLPSWFIGVQTLMTFAALFHMIIIIIYPMPLFTPYNTTPLKLICTLNAALASLTTISVVVFGVMIGLDRTWMPGWRHNKLGWSYGLVVLSGFLSWFSLISICVYTNMRQYDLDRDPSKATKSESKRRIFSRTPRI